MHLSTGPPPEKVRGRAEKTEERRRGRGTSPGIGPDGTKNAL